MTPYFCVAFLHSWLSLLCPVMIWAVLLSFFLALLMAIKEGIEQLQRLHQIPCDRCRYYTGSQYLKCPVNPLTAFSENAIHCRDYEPIDHHRAPRHMSRSGKK